MGSDTPFWLFGFERFIHGNVPCIVLEIQVSALSSRLLAIESDLQAERSGRRESEAEAELLRSSLAACKAEAEERGAEIKALGRRLDEERDRCRETIAAHKR